MNTSAQGQQQTDASSVGEPVRQHIVSNPFPSQPVSHNVEAPVAQSSPQVQPAVSQSAAATPLLAADNDLIEKDWVNLVEKTIEELGADPYQLQARQAALSQEYLKKRFNLDVGQS